VTGNTIFWVIVALGVLYILAMLTGIGPESALPSMQGECDPEAWEFIVMPLFVMSLREEP
jgi:hypothetical protein